MTNDESITAKITNESGQETSVIIDEHGNQVQVGEAVDPEVQEMLDMMTGLMQMGDDDE